MKRILITGKKGYLGTSLKQYLSQWPEYEVTSLSLREGQWEAFDLRATRKIIMFHMNKKSVPKGTPLSYAALRI